MRPFSGEQPHLTNPCIKSAGMHVCCTNDFRFYIDKLFHPIPPFGFSLIYFQYHMPFLYGDKLLLLCNPLENAKPLFFYFPRTLGLLGFSMTRISIPFVISPDLTVAFSMGLSEPFAMT